MTTRPQENPTPYRNGHPHLSRTLRNAAAIVAIPAAIAAVTAGGLGASSNRAASAFTYIALGAGAIAALLFLGFVRTAPQPTLDDRIAEVRDTIGALQDLLARLLRDRNADPGVIAEVRALTAGLTVSPNDSMALAQANRRLALSAVEASGAGPLAISAAPAVTSGGTR